MDEAKEADDITPECLTFYGCKVVLLEPYLMPFLIDKPDLRYQEDQLHLHVRRDPIT